ARGGCAAPNARAFGKAVDRRRTTGIDQARERERRVHLLREQHRIRLVLRGVVDPAGLETGRDAVAERHVAREQRIDWGWGHHQVFGRIARRKRRYRDDRQRAGDDISLSRHRRFSRMRGRWRQKLARMLSEMTLASSV